jgi:acylphosphatase
MGQRRVRLRIRGRVQGVFYRDSTQREAQRLGLHGWVRNRSDGSVEAVAQGPPEQVAALIDWCHEGPALARVLEVGVTEDPPMRCRLRVSYLIFRSVQHMPLFYYCLAFHVVVECIEISYLGREHHQPLEQ